MNFPKIMISNDGNTVIYALEAEEGCVDAVVLETKEKHLKVGEAPELLEYKYFTDYNENIKPEWTELINKYENRESRKSIKEDKQIISKELFTLVTGIEAEYVVAFKKYITNNTITFNKSKELDDEEELNLDTLGRNCREFINNNEFTIVLTAHSVDSFTYELENHRACGICYSNSAGDTSLLEVEIELAEYVAKELNLI